MRVAIITANTDIYKGTKANESGEAVKLVAEEAGLEVVFMRALPLDREVLSTVMKRMTDGNINWDEDHSYFCNFISKKLLEQSIFSNIEKEEITLIMSYIKECGMYAQKFNSGIIPENEVDIDKIAYTDNNLYDIICDKIGQLQKEHNLPIPYEKNDTIKR